MNLTDFEKVQYLKDRLGNLLIIKAAFTGEYPFRKTDDCSLFVSPSMGNIDTSIQLTDDAAEQTQELALAELDSRIETTKEQLKNLGVDATNWLPGRLIPNPSSWSLSTSCP